MVKVKVALVMCPCWGREAPPLSISLLKGILKSKEIDTQSFDLSNFFYNNVKYEFQKYWDQEHYGYWGNEASVAEFVANNGELVDKAVKMILNSGCSIVGFSILFSTMYFSLEIAYRLKIANPNIIIMMGGAHTSKFYAGSFLLSKDYVDALVIQEGDETLPEAVMNIELHGELREIPGLIYKKDGKIVDGGNRKPIKSLNDLAFADYSDFDLSTYAYPNRLDIFSSRSCILRCHYCDESIYFERFRFRTGESLFAEVIYQLERHKNVTFFNFSDSVLNGAVHEVRKFCELLINNNVKIEWGGQAVIRKEMTQELMQLMKKAGCNYLSYGVESGSDKVLKSMNKKLSSPEIASNVLKNTHEAGINTYANFMFGYPTETDEDFLETLEFIKNNRAYIDAVSPSQSFTVLFKNTYLYDNLEEFNIEPGSHHIYWETKDKSNTYLKRFKRYEMFCRLCSDLELTGVGVADEKVDKWRLLGGYYEYVEDFVEAFESYKTDLLSNGYNVVSLEKFIQNANKIGKDIEAEALIRVFDFNKIKKSDASNEIVDTTSKHSDANWINGVANGWAAAFFVNNSEPSRRELTVGRSMQFEDGSIRSIIDVVLNGVSLIVYLDGLPLDGEKVGYPKKFKFLN